MLPRRTHCGFTLGKLCNHMDVVSLAQAPAATVQDGALCHNERFTQKAIRHPYSTLV